MPARDSAPSQPAGDLWNASGQARQSMTRTARIPGDPGRDYAATSTLVIHASGRPIAAQLGDDAGIVGIAEAWQLANDETFS